MTVTGKKCGARSKALSRHFDAVRALPTQPSHTRFDSQRQHHAFEADEDEQAILNRQAVGSIPTGRTKFLELWPNGEALDF